MTLSCRYVFTELVRTHTVLDDGPKYHPAATWPIWTEAFYRYRNWNGKPEPAVADISMLAHVLEPSPLRLGEIAERQVCQPPRVY
jgi:hypothetical protein